MKTWTVKEGSVVDIDVDKDAITSSEGRSLLDLIFFEIWGFSGYFAVEQRDKDSRLVWQKGAEVSIFLISRPGEMG